MKDDQQLVKVKVKEKDEKKRVPDCPTHDTYSSITGTGTCACILYDTYIHMTYMTYERSHTGVVHTGSTCTMYHTWHDMTEVSILLDSTTTVVFSIFIYLFAHFTNALLVFLVKFLVQCDRWFWKLFQQSMSDVAVV